MKRLLVAVVLVGLAVVGLHELGDLTQTRPDRPPRGSRTSLVFEVDAHKYAPGVDQAAVNLWAACSHLTWSRVVNGGPVRISDGDDFEIVVQPALGAYSRRKVVGCLEDFTIDRVLGDVESITMTTVPAGPPPSARTDDRSAASGST